ncbi:MAG: 3-deoxy-8-phosphooctulonate synthase [Candidatus Krumholzibacteria bacterium]|jgi:2-dehydro-3-deoxyphosphooctonate aldolase (KDO 8-P synthase)|nr:3-deoxy-8-phosphooctulonate synthase [Candidatus Krumholzibacteria bacterium]MDP6669455.1 3-deoxy-8-phosphooctulonate synthase [Candidatus Krumholzibacteria bacterium]MDP6797291.1 3-deoxy-8-phosphooctulonate synthase [Candidatus Krumholzibacteria bacterium]MDP7021222.1 3-deoxy-8-phosphooctulonate synthase [Candidatus Krumholzibacteria bacterium]
MSRFSIGSAEVGGRRPLLIAGPCVVEGRRMLEDSAAFLAELSRRLDWPLVFKASFLKDNRLSVDSFRGLDPQEALGMIGEVAQGAGLPSITDIHQVEDAARAAEVVDALQIPAFLCRQSSLLEAAGATGLPVNIKRGQFLSPSDLPFSAEKVRRAGSDRILLTERGSSFGYRDLMVDFRSFPTMRHSGHPVLFDLTHSQQQPGAAGGSTGGSREHVLPMARAALAMGVDGFFLEVHPDPENALSDSTTQLDFKQAEELLENLETLASAMEAGNALP